MFDQLMFIFREKQYVRFTLNNVIYEFLPFYI